jgi:DNA-binding SARP family transcriptional activator
LTGFQHASFRPGLLGALERLMWLAIQRRQPEKVAALASLAEPPVAPNLYELALAIPQARALVLGGDAAAALALLRETRPKLEALEAALYLARLDLHEALALATLGDAAGAAVARQRAENAGYAFLLAEDRGLQLALAPAPTTGKLALLTFGPLEVLVDGARVDSWPRRKAKVLLAALLLHPHGLSYAELGDFLGEHDPGTLNSLRASMVALRRALEPNLTGAAASRYIRQHEDRYLLDAGETDLQAFQRELEAARTAEPTAAAAHYEAALALYRGHFLDDALFQAPFEPMRESLRRQAIEAASWLAEFHHARYDDRAAEKAYQRAQSLAPWDGELALALMRHYRFRNRPERIKQVYWDYRKALKAHLGLAPDDEFEAAYRALA